MQKQEVEPERLQELLHEITYHWRGNHVVMRKTERVLLRLIGEFTKRELVKSIKRPR